MPGPEDAGAAGPAVSSEATADPIPWIDEPAAEDERRFEAGGEVWIARKAGESAIGHGAGARAYIVAVRFFRAGDETPVSEVLIPRGRFETLYDEELVELLHRATPLKDTLPRDRGRASARAELEDELPPEG